MVAPAAMQPLSMVFDDVKVRRHEATGAEASDQTQLYSFIAATENGVLSFRGREHLVLRGLDMTRFNKNPVILWNHDANEPIGAAQDIRVRGSELPIEIRFGSNAKAQRVRQDVDDDIVRAVSVRFLPDRNLGSVVFVERGVTRTIDGIRAVGPAIVIRKSQLVEVSILTIPRDEDSLRRDFDALWDNRRSFMEDSSTTPPTPPTPGPTDDATQRDAAAPPPPATPITAPTDDGDVMAIARLRGVCPESLRGECDGIILECSKNGAFDYAEGHKRLLALHAERNKGIGTADAPAPAAPEPEGPTMTPEECARSFNAIR